MREVRNNLMYHFSFQDMTREHDASRWLVENNRLLSFEGEARLKENHGIRDRTSKGKARFQHLLWKRVAPLRKA
ncbi:hypothetical protein RND71_012530 [Anisodus tanguticus]|uniref:Uncharacterized protein n=1 Tax=Anisodus tanguticus TaxID=243964 RepID=A0AAE1VG29_9SOLA|nr:hypothetical protein RND71_012530 [Anisodus tanguticus]